MGILTQQSNHAFELTQRDAWRAEIELLRRWLKGRSGTLLLEFNIPRMGLRADAVLVIAGCIVVLEFKVGDSTVGQSALNQVWQYALDTKNFHETSHGLPIIPVLVVRSPPSPARTVAQWPHATRQTSGIAASTSSTPGPSSQKRDPARATLDRNLHARFLTPGKSACLWFDSALGR